MIKRHERDLFVLTWSEEHGDPQIIASLKEEIRDLENDNFSFSLFVKSKQRIEDASYKRAKRNHC